MAGAILGHSTIAATQVYAHLQADPSKRVADRVTEKIAMAWKAGGTEASS
jgi:site-specific recombinase XerC